MRKRKNKLYTLEDVRIWRELKKDELDLEKLKFYTEKERFKSEFTESVGKIFLYEGLLRLGEKIAFSLLKSVLYPKDKKAESSKEKNDEENSESK